MNFLSKLFKKINKTEKVDEIEAVKIEKMKEIEVIQGEMNDNIMQEMKAEEKIEGNEYLTQNEFDKETGIESLNLSVRARNALCSHGIKDLDRLSKLTINELRGIRNLGAKTTDEILLKMSNLGYELKEEVVQLEKQELSGLDTGYNFIMSMRFIEKLFDYPIKQRFSDNKNEEILKRLDNSLNTLDEKNKEILICRYGILDGKFKTLEEVGDIYGLTRERIRQIELKSIEKLKEIKRSGILKTYFEKLNDLDLTDYILSCVKENKI